jgi:ABC-2 type transport system ATP-binding protein
VIETSDEVRVLHTLTSWSLDNRIDLVGLTVDRPSLEDVYLELTSAEAAE